MAMRCKTVFKKSVIDNNAALNLYDYLRDTIEWEDGVYSRKGFTRKAKSLAIGDVPQIDNVIMQALHAMASTSYAIFQIYLNYYENGDMWIPNHSHKGTHQLIISLETTRVLQVGNNDYIMDNGDSILFGSAIHGIKKDNSINGRISIATFMVPSSTLPSNALTSNTLPFNTLNKQINDPDIDEEQVLIETLIKMGIA